MRKRKVLALLSLLGLIVLIAVGVMHLYLNGNNDTGADKAESVSASGESASSAESEDVPYVTYTPTVEMENAEALQAAKEVNPEVKGWLAITGTGISAPVAQASDNTFYRANNWQGEESADGAYFFDHECNVDYGLDLSPNVVIYGRDTLFEQLENYLDHDFFNTNNNISLTLSDYEMPYQIISAGFLDTEQAAPMLAANPTPEEFTEVLAFMESINVHETAAANERIINIITLIAYSEDNTQALAVVGKLAL